MNKKISLGLAISLVAIGCAITFVLTWTVSLGVYNSKISSSDKYEGVYDKLKEMDVTVRTNYIGTLNDDDIQNGIINGYVSGIGDKYAGYMPADSYYELQETIGGVITGPGFEAEANGSGYLAVTYVYKGGSAEANDVKVGDIITEIDGRSLLSMEPSAALAKITGEVGTKISLRLLRGTEEFDVSLVRQQIEIESVSEEILDNGVGYMKITSFNGKTSEQFSQALNALVNDGATSLVIDLRQNGGGTISVLKPMLNRLIPAATVATAEYSGGVKKTLIETDSSEVVSMKMAILVDGGTASAAELFAVALKDECGAVLVGNQTFGKGVIQNTYELSDGSALSFSTAKIIPSKSEPYDGVGLKPDYVTDLPSGTTPEYVSRESDTQLLKALEVLDSAGDTVPQNPPASDTSDAGSSEETGEQSAESSASSSGSSEPSSSGSSSSSKPASSSDRQSTSSSAE